MSLTKTAGLLMEVHPILHSNVAYKKLSTTSLKSMKTVQFINHTHRWKRRQLFYSLVKTSLIQKKRKESDLIFYTDKENTNIPYLTQKTSILSKNPTQQSSFRTSNLTATNLRKFAFQRRFGSIKNFYNRSNNLGESSLVRK
jgi:hypothetical protein